MSQVFGSLLSGIVAQVFDYRGTMYVAALLTVLAFLTFRVGLAREASAVKA